jgi:hypothetical protein
MYGALAKQGHPVCHQLHFLQMAAEKISKAYFWRSGKAPRKSHAGFAQFIRTLPSSTQSVERERVAQVLGFSSYNAFKSWANRGLPIAYDLEKLAPALAMDGVNTEYPWPSSSPANTPVDHDFAVGRLLAENSEGRQFLRFLGRAIQNFASYA